jgi:hypothetical protein
MAGNPVVASPQVGVGNQTDVFAIKNGQLTVSWVNGPGAWQGPVGLGPTGAFRNGAALAASPQYGAPNQTDVFAVNNNGQLNVFWVDGAAAWQGPVGLGPTGAFPPGAGLAASNQYGVPNQTDVFAIGDNGQLHVFWVNGPGNWQGPVGLGPVGAFPPGAGLAASPQYGAPNQTDVFAVSNNGQLNVFWVDGGGAWQGPVGLGPTGAFPPGAALAASNQFGVPNQTDVFVIGDTGQLHVFWVNGPGNWQGPVGLGAALPPGAGVAASPQYGAPNQTDVFAIGNDGLLNIFWVDGGGAWKGPVVLGPPPHISLRAIQDAQGRFVEVDGDSFTPGRGVGLTYDIFTGGAPSTHQTGEQGTTADGGGRFAARIKVNLGSISGASVKATDTVSGRSATASL